MTVKLKFLPIAAQMDRRKGCYVKLININQSRLKVMEKNWLYRIIFKVASNHAVTYFKVAFTGGAKSKVPTPKLYRFIILKWL
jgi:hypothetical protein